ncbi:hypothetical protein V6N13_061133 [Hibiscus sabdariffa]
MIPRGEGPFQVVKKINDNAYQLDLPGEFNVSATFNVVDLSPYDGDDNLGTNRFKEGGTDVIPSNKESEEYPSGRITRARAKKFQATIEICLCQAWNVREKGQPQ